MTKRTIKEYIMITLGTALLSAADQFAAANSDRNKSRLCGHMMTDSTTYFDQIYYSMRLSFMSIKKTGKRCRLSALLDVHGGS